MKEKVCVLTSGGIESAALLCFYAKQNCIVYPLYVRHGFRWEKAELYWLKKLLGSLKRSSIRPLTVLDAPLGPVLKKHWSIGGGKVPSETSDDASVYLPGRNLLLISLANTFCAVKKIRRIALGTLGTNPFPDGSAAFFDILEKTLGRERRETIKIERPFGNLSKTEAMKRAPETPFPLTFSCINPRGFSHCGKCNKCAERKKAERGHT